MWQNQIWTRVTEPGSPALQADSLPSGHQGGPQILQPQPNVQLVLLKAEDTPAHSTVCTRSVLPGFGAYALAGLYLWCLYILPPCLLSGWYRSKPNVNFIWTPILRRPVCKYSQNSSYKTYCATLWCFCVPSRLTHYSTLQNPRTWYIVMGTSSIFVEWIAKFNRCYAFLTQCKSNSYILK